MGVSDISMLVIFPWLMPAQWQDTPQSFSQTFKLDRKYGVLGQFRVSTEHRARLQNSERVYKHRTRREASPCKVQQTCRRRKHTRPHTHTRAETKNTDSQALEHGRTQTRRTSPCIKSTRINPKNRREDKRTKRQEDKKIGSKQEG